MHSSLNGTKPLLLVFPHNLLAHYIRCLHLAKYLQKYFRVMFLNSPCFHRIIKESDFETFECAALDAEKVQQGIVSFNFDWLNERDLNLIYKSQVRTLDELKPVAVLGDMSPTLKMAAEKKGVIYFSLMNGYMSRHYAFVRKLPRNFPLYKVCNDLPSSLSGYLISMGEEISFRKIHRSFNKIRKNENLSYLRSYLQELEGDMNLLCDLPEIFPQKNLPSNYYFVPPLYHHFKNNYSAIEKTSKDKKTIYVSMGSTGNWQKVAFLNNADYHKYTIVTAGDSERIIHGPNVHAYSFVDDRKLLANADLVICHGGNGTTYQALSFGLPVLCKTSHCEQEYNVDGLERMQLGKSLDDITVDDDYLPLIEEWIQKKNNAQLLFIKNKIAEANNRFEQTIKEMLTTKSAAKMLKKSQKVSL